tara:strand:- start:2607 stop:3041 length:435 start_codon:yes stop_codon:yes gene_type:complete
VALTHVQVLDNVAGIIEAGTSLSESAELLDPRNAPEAALNRAFSVMPSAIANTGQYRDRVSTVERVRYDLDIVCVWAQDVHNYSTTRDVALGDALATIQALESDTTTSSELWSVHHTTSSFSTHPSLEWLFGNLRFSVETDVAL